MFLILSAATLVVGAALMDTHGVLIFLAGFLAGWATSAVRSHRRDAAGAP